MTRLVLAVAAALALACCVEDTYLAGPWDAAVVTCGNGILEVGEECDDGNPDADDGCSPTCTLEAGTEADCGNEQDDDGDGKADCADPDCDGQACGTGTGAVCQSYTCVETTCGDGLDNDEDGLVDCVDESDCAGQPCGSGGACRGVECR